MKAFDKWWKDRMKSDYGPSYKDIAKEAFHAGMEIQNVRNKMPVCNHDQLKRSCQLCEYETEVAELQSKIAANNYEIHRLNKEVERLNAEVERLKSEIECQGGIIQSATEGWVPAVLYDAVKDKLSRYEGGVEVEDVVLGTTNDFAQRQGMIYLPANLIGQRVKILVMKDEG